MGKGPGGIVVTAIFAAVVATAAGAGTPSQKPAAPDPATLHFLPRARPLSTYTLDGRFEMMARDVTFEAPEAYQEGFNFWAGRMKGQKTSEVCEMITITQDADSGGLVPFRRTIPKYDVEVEKQGQIFVPGGAIEKSVAALMWEGALDPFGNVKEMSKVAGKDDAQIEELAIPEMAGLFPKIEAPRDLKIGEGFKEERVVRLPTKLSIVGLENISLKVTREYTLKSVSGDLATFEVKTTYANNPAFKPAMEKTTCSISGGGSGEAVFEIKRGVFRESRLPTSMRVDIEAPLRPLPDHPETATPLLGKSHIDIDLLLTGRQSVKRVWGDEPD